MILRVLPGVVLVYAVVVVFMWVFQGRLLYQTGFMTDQAATPTRAGLDWEPGEIVVHGRSLGAAVAAELAREVTPGAVILESPFRSVPLMASRLYPFLPARWLARFDYATQDYVRDIAVPVLVIHSREDEIIPFEEGEAVYQAANEPKEMLVIEGGHNTGFLVSEQAYLNGIGQFLSRHQERRGE